MYDCEPGTRVVVSVKGLGGWYRVHRAPVDQDAGTIYAHGGKNYITLVQDCPDIQPNDVVVLECVRHGVWQIVKATE